LSQRHYRSIRCSNTDIVLLVDSRDDSYDLLT